MPKIKSPAWRNLIAIIAGSFTPTAAVFLFSELKFPFLFLVFGYCCVVSILIAFPLYLFIRPHWKVKLITPIIAGGLTGVFTQMFGLLLMGLPPAIIPDAFGISLGLGISGGLTAWAVWMWLNGYFDKVV